MTMQSLLLTGNDVFYELNEMRGVKRYAIHSRAMNARSVPSMGWTVPADTIGRGWMPPRRA